MLKSTGEGILIARDSRSCLVVMLEAVWSVLSQLLMRVLLKVY
jgi:hypothetical protein